MRNAHSRSSYPADWYIEDNEPVAQDVDHQKHEFIMQSTFLAWQARTKQEHLLIGCEVACRWDSRHPKVGVDPDVYIVERPPGEEGTGYIGSVRTWENGNSPPILAIEIVSRSRPGKDYKDSPEKHDLLGTFELWVFDPGLNGYTDEQPPALLQIFQRETNQRLVQTCAGEGPFRSDALDAWVMVIDEKLVVANDREGKDRWPTLEEAALRVADEHAKRADEHAKRADEHAKRADEHAKRADEERLAREKAEARNAELEALLARRSS
jgi:Uma2 family endonuclease